MHFQTPHNTNFFIAGINYKKTDAAVRGQFAVNNEQYISLLQHAAGAGIRELFVVSTCNRTEIYGYAQDALQLIRLLCTVTEGTEDTFLRLAYIKKGKEAVKHLLNVGAGLDSQILGDYEIVGQIKQAARISKEHGMLGAFTERLVNCMLQCSKAIKNQTALSGGTVSVSFAAVQYIKTKVQDIADKKILLIGVGKIGRNTCKNLVDYLQTTNITLINRTEEKAADLADKLGVQYAQLQDMPQLIASSHIILVATNAAEPIIWRTCLENSGDKLIIDLSIPYNVEAAAMHLPNVKLVNVDELSKLKDETLQKRKAEVPKAKAIIAAHLEEFLEWHEMRRHVPVLKAVKVKLKEIYTHPLYIQFSRTHSTRTAGHNGHAETEKRIQRVINGMASKMRSQNTRGCHYIEAINEFIATGAN
ncbi:MAG TPA: glutamyl-tRNA reductase [Chitinophagaceae bacterium]|nr:glutamyl-tRNA reductase [Chitinophagaceae bacterium]